LLLAMNARVRSATAHDADLFVKKRRHGILYNRLHTQAIFLGLPPVVFFAVVCNFKKVSHRKFNR
jgi:hypothetical protein